MFKINSLKSGNKLVKGELLNKYAVGLKVVSFVNQILAFLFIFAPFVCVFYGSEFLYSHSTEAVTGSSSPAP